MSLKLPTLHTMLSSGCCFTRGWVARGFSEFNTGLKSRKIRMRIPVPAPRLTSSEDGSQSEKVPEVDIQAVAKPFNESFAFETELLKASPPKQPAYQEGLAAPRIDSKLIATDEQNLLPYDHFPLGLEAPLKVYSEIRRPGEDIESRLSVTSLLTERWCELKEFYRYYVVNKEQERTAAMKRGTEQHEILELKSHKVENIALEVPGEPELGAETTDGGAKTVNVKIEKTAYLEPLKIPQSQMPAVMQDVTEAFAESRDEILRYLSKTGLTELEKLTLEWNKNLARLAGLLRFGESREILIHGLLRPSTMKFLDHRDIEEYADESVFEEDVLVTGIIDHVILESALEGGMRQYKKELYDKMSQAVAGSEEAERDLYDLDVLIDAVRQVTHDGWNAADLSRQKLRLVVKDIKTRAFKNAPKQQRVRSASRDQVMYYRKFLGLVAGESATGRNSTEADESIPGHFAYVTLLANAKKKGVDIDLPLAPEFAVTLLLNNQYLEHDLVRLSKGESIGFGPLDRELTGSKPGYGLAAISPMYASTNSSHSVDKLIANRVHPELVREWHSPLTLRVIAARIAQMFSLLRPLLSDRCAVEYVTNGATFLQRSFYYDERLLEAKTRSSMEFWLGLRPPRPVPKEDIGTYCKFCEFKSNCKWYQEHV